jgi:hypothetical protein
MKRVVIGCIYIDVLGHVLCLFISSTQGMPLRNEKPSVRREQKFLLSSFGKQFGFRN